MKPLLYSLMFSALLAGCALTTMTTKDEVNHPDPEPVESTSEHLGDPTFTHETTEETVETPREQPTDENAVVDAGESAPKVKATVDAVTGEIKEWEEERSSDWVEKYSNLR